jgi:small-conductance mechanosensitive channel
MTKWLFLYLGGLLLLPVTLTGQVHDSLQTGTGPIKQDSLSGVAIAPNGEELFRLQKGVGAFTTVERAAAVTKRIQTLADDRRIQPDSLKLLEEDTGYMIAYGEIEVVLVQPKDTFGSGLTQKALATTWHKSIQEYITSYRATAGWGYLAYEIGVSLGVIFVFGLFVWLLRMLYRRLRIWLRGERGKLLRPITIKNYILLDENQVVQVSLSLLNVLRWLLVILTGFIALPLVFSLFPWTEAYAWEFIGYIFRPIQRIGQATLNYLPNLITLAIIWLLVRLLLRLIHFLANEVKNGDLKLPNFYPEWASPTYSILRFLIYAFSLVVAFPYLPGSGSAAFQGVSVFLGILISLGSSSAIANIVSGLVITYMRPFKVGDYIKIGDSLGTVLEKNLLIVRLMTIKNEEITVPNSAVLSNHTLNYSSQAEATGVILYTTVTIGYDAPWQQVHDLLLTAADRTESVEKMPKPFVLQTSLDDFYVSYQLNVFTRLANQMPLVYSRLHAQIQDSFNESGVEIMSPHFTQLRDGSSTTIPSEYLPKDYKPTVSK